MGPQKLWISARLWHHRNCFGKQDWADRRRYDAWDFMEDYLWSLETAYV